MLYILSLFVYKTQFINRNKKMLLFDVEYVLNLIRCSCIVY